MDPIQLHSAFLLLQDLIKEATGDTGNGSKFSGLLLSSP